MNVSNLRRFTMPARQVILWDLPTRLVHWALALAVLGAFVTQWVGAAMWLHMDFGYAAATLVVFRVFWGIVGSDTARFAQFVRGPAAVWRYLTTGWHEHPGHNPLGGWSVLALLVVVLVQSGTGLFSNDDVFFDGPWAGFVGKQASNAATGFHSLNESLLLALIGLHVAAIAWYYWRGENLVGPMVTGVKAVPTDMSEPRRRPLWLAVVGLVVSAALTGVAFRFWLL